MSLILDALRKSEAERRLGQAPDVLAPMPVMHASAPRPRRYAAITGVTMALLAVAGWWMLGRSSSSVATSVAPSAMPSAAQSKAAIPNHFAITAAPVVSPPVVSLGASPSPAPAPAAAASPHATPATASIGTTTASSRDVATPPASRAPDTPHATPVPAKSHDVSALALASAAKKAAALRTFTDLPSTPDAAPPSPPADEPSLLSVSDLPSSERSALPALKVTMHVYTDDPARRFMIVDGQRVGEGTRIGVGIVLVRIRRDGAEIDASGRRLLLPNP